MSITYLRKGDQQLEIRHRIFKDDLELVVGSFERPTGKTLHDSLQRKIFDYLESHTKVILNDSVIPSQLESVLIEGEGATCTIECRRVIIFSGRAESFVFENRILLDELDAQINMTHYISEKGRLSKNLDGRITRFKIFDNN